MKLICVVPIPHGLRHLTAGEEFDEPDQKRAEMLTFLGRARAAAPEVVPQASAPVYQTAAVEPEADAASEPAAETARAKRTYKRRDMAAGS